MVSSGWGLLYQALVFVMGRGAQLDAVVSHDNSMLVRAAKNADQWSVPDDEP